MPVLRFIYTHTKNFRLPILGMFLCFAIIATALNMQNYLFKILVDVLSGQSDFTLNHIAIGFIGIQGILLFTWFIYDYLLISFQGLRTQITASISAHVLKYDINFFQNMQGGSVASKIKDAASLTNSIFHLIIDNYFFITLKIIISFILLFQVNWIFGLSLICWSLFSIAFFTTAALRLNKIGKQVAAADAKIYGRFSDIFTNILTTKLFSAATYEKRKLSDALDTYLHLKKTNVRQFTIMWFFFSSAFLVYMAGCIYALINLFNAHQITTGDFAFVLIMHYKIIDNFYSIGNSLREFLSNWATIQEAIKIMDLPLRVQDKENALTMSKPQGHIKFNNVEFSYPGVASLFNKKNIEIFPGEKVGLVGFSGAGKSTFVNLILRLYDVSAGTITLDGIDISTATQDSLRSHIAMIPQDPTLFHRSIYDNIAYGHDHVTKSEIIDAAKKAHADEFISKLPNGYQSHVGERGVKLSGGQRQRIAIARAFLKKAPILMLDEATSQLDSLTEAHIQAALWELMQGKTTLIIAHRLSTLLKMDRILVFDHGHIVEDGTHAELLETGAHYKKLWQAQVGGFLPNAE